MEEMKNELKAIENGLVPVYETSTGEKVVYGTELYAALGVESRFNDWIKNRLNDCDAKENEDYESFTKNLVKGGRPTKEHIIKLDTAKEMAMLERNGKGKQVRRYFIQLEKKYKEAQRIVQTQSKTFLEFMERQVKTNQDQMEFNRMVLEKMGADKETIKSSIPIEHPHRPVYIREKSIRDEEILCYRRKRINSLVNKVSRLNGMKRNVILHNLYKRLEEKLEVSLDSYMDVYQTETGRFDFTTMEVVIAYDYLCKNAIEELSKMVKYLSCDENEIDL